jgi:prephenate dehydrogenase
MTIGIIGSGRFGDLLFNTFSKKDEYETQLFQPKIYSRSKQIDNTKYYSLEEVCGSDIVIPCVPISIFENTIKDIKNLLKPECLLVDICSVSVHPAEVMLDEIDESIDLLSSHPMFGPDSSKNGTTFLDLKFIYHPLRIKNQEKYEIFLKFWKDLGCNMIPMTPEEHDKQAAYTHAFAFLIGKMGIKMNVRANQISTKGFEGILYNQQAVENDTGQLFQDMMTYNPFAKEMRKKAKESLEAIEKELGV